MRRDSWCFDGSGLLWSLVGVIWLSGTIRSSVGWNQEERIARNDQWMCVFMGVEAIDYLPTLKVEVSFVVVDVIK